MAYSEVFLVNLCDFFNFTAYLMFVFGLPVYLILEMESYKHINKIRVLYVLMIIYMIIVKIFVPSTSQITELLK